MNKTAKTSKKLALQAMRLRELTSGQTMRVVGGNEDLIIQYPTVEPWSCTYGPW